MRPLFNGETTGTGKVGQEEAMIKFVDIGDAFGATCSLSVSEKKGEAFGVFGLTVRADVTKVFQVCPCCR